jgi:hypothetical protein
MLTTLEHLCVRVVNGDIKAKSLEKNVFIVYQLLSLFNVLLKVNVNQIMMSNMFEG